MTREAPTLTVSLVSYLPMAEYGPHEYSPHERPSWLSSRVKIMPLMRNGWGGSRLAFLPGHLPRNHRFELDTSLGFVLHTPRPVTY